MGTNQFTQYINAYLGNLKTIGHSPETLSTYGRVLNSMARAISSAHEGISLDGIRGYMLEGFVRGMGDLAPASYNLYVTIIKLFFGYLEDAGYIERDPSNVLRKVKVVVNDDPFEGSSDNKTYTDREVLQLMRSISGNLAERDKALVALLSGSGLRASEVCSLTLHQWNNMQNSHVYVRRKGGAWRWVAIASYVMPYVLEYLETRGVVEDSDPLFITSAGNQITRQALYKILKKRQEDAGLQSGVHIFRHTFLTGTSKVSNEKIAQSLANHSNASTTKRYIHSTAAERLAAVDNTAWAREMELQI